MRNQTHSQFLLKLKQEAQLQAKLQQSRFLPEELDSLTSFIGRHSWQVIVVASGVTSLALELLKVVL